MVCRKDVGNGRFDKTMIILTRLAPTILEIAIIGVATNEDLRDLLQAFEKETDRGAVAILLNVLGRTERAAMVDLFYRHIAGRYMSQVSRMALVGPTSEEELAMIGVSLDTEVEAFEDKPTAIKWLKGR